MQACPSLELKGADGYTPYELAASVYETNEHKQIAAHLKRVEEFFEWLARHQLSSFRWIFLKHAVTIEHLKEATDKYLSDIGISKQEDRDHILNSCRNKSQGMFFTTKQS